MATTTTAASLTLQKWRSNYWREYVRESGFKKFMGKNPMNVIHVLHELQVGGKTITVPLVGRLTGAGVTGNSTLSGNEEALSDYGHDIVVDYRRHAVQLTKREIQYSAADQLSVVRPLLKEWSTSNLRADIIASLHTIDGVVYGTASEANKDAWLVDNVDRILFATGAGHATDQSAGLLTVTAAMTMSAAIVGLAKRKAKAADPHIRPFRVGDEGREFFVLFVDSPSMRDLKADSVMQQANREARVRGVESNPIFQDGDLIYDGVIIREIPEIATIGTVGASSAAVSPAFLCGAQALGVAYGQMPKPTTKKEDDYGFIKGRGIEECLGVSKIQRDIGGDLSDHGVLTVYVGAAAD